MAEDQESSSSARHLFVYAGTDSKAGMQEMDEKKQLQVISNFSRGSAYNKHAEKMGARHDEPIKRLIAASETMSVADVIEYNQRAEKEVKRLESIRSFATVGHGFGDELTLFLGTIRKFNFNNSLDDELRIKIEKYFDFRWRHDKNNESMGGKSKEIFD